MFRSSLATMIGGSFAGIATAVTSGEDHRILEAAMASLITSMAIAISDHFSRKRKFREHEERFVGEHEKTRAAVNRLRVSRKPARGVKKNG